ncbi:MAG: TIGR01212 family radical SAM protein [Proteobacteria bacterium]|nr:TIGR01212 family radical SAM protein [Pseudomonadota bacterium]
MPSIPRKRWNYFKDRLIERFGEIVYKIGVDAGFDCPNRDGTKAYGGCAYCSQQGSFSPQQDPKSNIQQQLEKGIWFTQKRYGAEKFIVYFQAFTNTYADPDTLRQRYQSALIDPRIVGMSIATRPDCINSENIKVLKEFQEKLPFFTVELGLQSAHQNELSWVNRQETLEDYKMAMKLLIESKIPVISHIILGFPEETFQDMLDTVKIAQECGSYGLKLQMLHVIRGTKLAHMYDKNPFKLMSQDEYLELIVELIQHIDPKVELHRITGETEEKSLVAPEWVRHKTRIFDAFDNILATRDLWQGKKWGVKNTTPDTNILRL